MPIIKQDLIDIYNGCLKYSVFPNEWKIGQVVTIRKGQNKDPTDPKSYRPICLLPILGKILEALILYRLSNAIDSQFSPRQYEFRKQRSTENAIRKLREIVEESQHKYVLAIFLDIKGAFDNVWWPSILNELKKRRCPRNIYLLIKDYLNGRKVLIRNMYDETTRDINKGCPQGSVLGPTLWNLIIDIILWTITEANGQTIAYADDQAILIEGNSRRELETKGQEMIDKVTDWCKQQKLQLAPEKCAMMLLKGKLHKKVSPKIRIENKGIKREEKFKYLGVTIGTGMSAAPHIKAISEKTKNLFDSLGRIARRDWGLGFKAMNTIYKGLYIPIMTYAATAWYDKTNNEQRRKLEMSQRKALIKVTGAYRTTAAHSLTVITGNLPITLECQKRAETYKVRKKKPFKIGDYTYEGETDTIQTIEEEQNKKKEAKQKIHTGKIETWQTTWNNSTKGRHTYKFISSIKDRLEAIWIDINEIRWIAQFITGHGNFKSYKERFGITKNKNCSCGEEDTPIHVLKHCPKYNHLRQKYTQENRIENWTEIKEHEKLEADKYHGLVKFAKEILTTKELTEALEEDENGEEEEQNETDNNTQQNSEEEETDTDLDEEETSTTTSEN